MVASLRSLTSRQRTSNIGCLPTRRTLQLQCAVDSLPRTRFAGDTGSRWKNSRHGNACWTATELKGFGLPGFIGQREIDEWSER
jgi:hypothetical protein